MNEWETCIAEWATRCHEKDATIAALQAIIKQMGEQACVLAKDGMAAKAQVEALQRELESANALLHKKNCAIGKAETTIEALQRERDEANLYRDQARANQESLAACVDRDVRKIKDLQAALDAEREKVKGLHEITKVICAHCCEPMEIPSKAVLQTQLGRTLPATTPAGQRWTRRRPTAPGWYWWREGLDAQPALYPVEWKPVWKCWGIPGKRVDEMLGEWQGPLTPNEAI